MENGNHENWNPLTNLEKETTSQCETSIDFQATLKLLEVLSQPAPNLSQWLLVEWMAKTSSVFTLTSSCSCRLHHCCILCSHKRSVHDLHTHNICRLGRRVCEALEDPDDYLSTRVWVQTSQWSAHNGCGNHIMTCMLRC